MGRRNHPRPTRTHDQLALQRKRPDRQRRLRLFRRVRQRHARQGDDDLQPARRRARRTRRQALRPRTQRPAGTRPRAAQGAAGSRRNRRRDAAVNGFLSKKSKRATKQPSKKPARLLSGRLLGCSLAFLLGENPCRGRGIPAGKSELKTCAEQGEPIELNGKGAAHSEAAENSNNRNPLMVNSQPAFGLVCLASDCLVAAMLTRSLIPPPTARFSEN